jgi:hypothetical protein
MFPEGLGFKIGQIMRMNVLCDNAYGVHVHHKPTIESRVYVSIYLHTFFAMYNATSPLNMQHNDDTWP